MKIYDCFLFFNELDLLELRLELMYDYVDYFVISECDCTFSGLKKPYYFENNKERYKKYMDKIIHIKHKNTDSLELKNTYNGNKGKFFEIIQESYNKIRFTALTDYGKPHWCRDFLHREFVKMGMNNCNDDDIIIFSDLDEIPIPEKIPLDGDSYVLKQKHMIYYFNKENITDKWYGPVIVKFSELKDKSLNEVRNSRKNEKLYKVVDDCGWHLSFMGGAEKIKQKVICYSHQEYNNNHILGNIENFINNNKDVFNINSNIFNIDIEKYYPPKVLDFIKKDFEKWVKV